MTPDEAGFFRTILDHPDDDAPRLIYADWLDDRGESERAEFIRVQIEAARLADDDPRQFILQRRVAALMPELFGAWNTPFHGHLVVRRGFIVRMQINGERELNALHDLLERGCSLGPMRHLIVESRWSALGRRNPLATSTILSILAQPEVCFIRKLTIGRIDVPVADALAVLPEHAALQQLVIEDSPLDTPSKLRLYRRFGRFMTIS